MGKEMSHLLEEEENVILISNKERFSHLQVLEVKEVARNERGSEYLIHVIHIWFLFFLLFPFGCS